MAATVILTGANGSAGIFAAEHVLSKYPEYTVVLTVRDASDQNTKNLRNIISKYPKAKASVHQVDLARLSAVHDFANTIASGITNKKYPPLSAIICNAYYWNLVSAEQDITEDGFDKSMQVAHIAHVAMVLKLLGHFGPEGGRVTLLSSDAHWPGKNGMEKYPPAVPEDMDQFVGASSVHDKNENVLGRGFQRYGNSKLAQTAWMYALNRHIQKSDGLPKITAVAIWPGSLTDSRALRTNTPGWLGMTQKFVLRPLLPVLRLTDGAMRSSKEAGVDIAELGLNKAHPGEVGYFALLKKTESSPDSMDEKLQEKLWAKSAEWARVAQNDTVVQLT